jgi:hypothetical protein
VRSRERERGFGAHWTTPDALAPPVLCHAIVFGGWSPDVGWLPAGTSSDGSFGMPSSS